MVVLWVEVSFFGGILSERFGLDLGLRMIGEIQFYDRDDETTK